MKNFRTIKNFQDELVILENDARSNKVIAFTKEHLENIALTCLNNQSLLCELDLNSVIHLFENSPLDGNFLSSWKFEFSGSKDKFNISFDFNLPVELPRNRFEVIQFWNSLIRLNEPIYYSSAISAAWGIEGWLKITRKLASYWIKNRSTPFFQFKTQSEFGLGWFSKPAGISFGHGRIFVINGNKVDFDYLNLMVCNSPEKLIEIQSLITPNISELCYN